MLQGSKENIQKPIDSLRTMILPVSHTSNYHNNQTLPLCI